MPESQRRAILLREWQGLSYREIAAELELSQTAVETLIFRARRSLAKGLAEPQARAEKRRAVRGADLGSLLTGLKSVLFGGAVGLVVARPVAAVPAGARLLGGRRHGIARAAGLVSGLALPLTRAPLGLRLRVVG